MRILRDLFPAKVKLIAREGAPSSDHTFYATRVIVTDAKIFIAADHASGPVVVFESPHRGSESELDSPLYSSAIISKDDNCGCGSRLRAWNPYRYVSA